MKWEKLTRLLARLHMEHEAAKGTLNLVHQETTKLSNDTASLIYYLQHTTLSSRQSSKDSRHIRVGRTLDLFVANHCRYLECY